MRYLIYCPPEAILQILSILSKKTGHCLCVFAPLRKKTPNPTCRQTGTFPL